MVSLALLSPDELQERERLLRRLSLSLSRPRLPLGFSTDLLFDLLREEEVEDLRLRLLERESSLEDEDELRVLRLLRPRPLERPRRRLQEEDDDDE